MRMHTLAPMWCVMFGGVFVLASLLPLQADQGATEQVTLKNGVTYEVETEEGMPIPFKSRDIAITMLGMVLNDSTKQFQWVLHANLKAAGRFTVTITTPVNIRESTTFSCTGPGELWHSFFERTAHPSLWTWITEPGETWIPFVFTFHNVATQKRFVATQWMKFNPGAKASLVEVWKRVP